MHFTHKFLLKYSVLLIISLYFSLIADDSAIDLALLDHHLTALVKATETLPAESIIPHARITDWAPAVRSSANLVYMFKGEPPLPIYVRIAFDQEVTDDFVNKFFRELNGSRPTRHGKFRKEFVIRVPASTSREAFEILVDKTNRYFDPQIAKREELARQQERDRQEKEAAARLAAELKLKADIEATRLRREIDVKRRADEREIALKLEKEKFEQEVAKKAEAVRRAEERRLKEEAEKAPRRALRAAIIDMLSPQERFEYDYLKRQYSQVMQQFFAMGGSMRSSAYKGVYPSYLRNVGTPVALLALEEFLDK